MTAPLELLDYRRRVLRLYAEVRELHDADARSAHAHWRAVRDQLFAHHPQSALAGHERATFTGLAYYDYNPAFSVVATVDEDAAGERFESVTSTGAPMTLERIGAVRTPWGSLDAFWIDDYGGGLFIPFRDETAGTTTYGGGRYLYDTAKGADLGSTASGQLVLDFNFAYHPSCHYDARWSCPLAGPGSRLDVAVEAGERSRVAAGVSR